MTRPFVVATAHPLASAAARAVLEEGGNAIDAAIAAQAVLGVVEPQASGLAGGVLLLAWMAADRQPVFLDGLARAPARVPADWLAGAPLAEVQRSGRVVGVPGAMRALAHAHRRFGRRPWAGLFAPAIHLAETGFPLAPYLHASLRARPELADKPWFRAAYFDGSGQPRPPGTTLRNPDLAATLRALAADPDALNTGPLARALADAARDHPMPGELTEADLAAYTPVERSPLRAEAFGHGIVTAAPPVSGGVALLQQLLLLERLGIAATAPGSAQAAHLMIEAARLSAADRRRWIGDPDQVVLPLPGLLAPDYLAARAALVSPRRALPGVAAGTPPGADATPASTPLGHTATSHLSIIDAAGNTVALTTTINQVFGSDIVVGGMVVNDALTNFAERGVIDGRRAANAIAPGKRPITTMAPTLVLDPAGHPVLALGAGGGARIIDSVAQTLLGVLAWNQDLRAAIEAPRIGGQNGAVELERGTAAATLAPALRALGHDPQVLEMNAAVQAAGSDADGLTGWADPRRDGVALGGKQAAGTRR